MDLTNIERENFRVITIDGNGVFFECKNHDYTTDNPRGRFLVYKLENKDVRAVSAMIGVYQFTGEQLHKAELAMRQHWLEQHGLELVPELNPHEMGSL